MPIAFGEQECGVGTIESGVLRQALMFVYLDDVARIVCSERLALK